MPVAVYLSPLLSLLSRGEQCRAVPTAGTQLSPAVLGHCPPQNPGRSLTAVAGIPLPPRRSSSVGAASKVLPQIAQPGSLTPAWWFGHSRWRRDIGVSVPALSWKCWDSQPPKAHQQMGWEHPQPFPCWGSSRASGIRDGTREFGLAASAQGCWRGVPGADRCCNC